MDKKEVNPEGSLMKKTKKELIEIIFRKDETEGQLNRQIKELKLRDEQLSASVDRAFDDYKDEIDNLTSINQEEKDKANNWKNTAIISILVNILVIVMMLFIIL